MPRNFVFLFIGLFFGTGLGFLIAASTGAELRGHDHDADAHDGGEMPAMVHDHAAHDHGENTHDHDRIVDAGDPAPTLSLVLHPDGPQSRNLEIRVKNFVFDPEHVNGPHMPGRGHAHVYLDGVKIARAYGPWLHLSALPKGRHELRVTLNTNDHRRLARNGVPIEARETLLIE